MADPLLPCPIAPILADRMRGAREALTTRWLDRISARVALDPIRVFPTDDLLDHVPVLIDGIAAYLESPVHEIPAYAPVVAKAMELGAMRHDQGFDEYEILKEFELLGGIIFAFLIREVPTIDVPCGADEVLVCSQRIFRAIALIQEASVAQYLQRMRRRLTERETQLRTFNRAVTHELKNQLASLIGAAELLEIEAIASTHRTELLHVVKRNAAAMHGVLDNLVELSHTDANARQHRRVLLPKAVAEAVRQLRDRAAAAGVVVRLGPMPDVEVVAAAVELAVTNFLSNAIKYADQALPERWVEIRGYLDDGEGERVRELVVEVVDNGRGVPIDKRGHLFEHGFRAHVESATGVEGTGLGLSIVRDAIEALGGRAWAAFPMHGGSCFAFALPARRAHETPPASHPAIGL